MKINSLYILLEGQVWIDIILMFSLDISYAQCIEIHVNSVDSLWVFFSVVSIIIQHGE